MTLTLTMLCNITSTYKVVILRFVEFTTVELCSNFIVTNICCNMIRPSVLVVDALIICSACNNNNNLFIVQISNTVQ